MDHNDPPIPEQRLDRLWTATTSACLPSPSLLDQWGRQALQKPGSLFSDLSPLLDHPLFQTFSQTYFREWSSVQLIVRLCQLYQQLDALSPQVVDPYEKLAVLHEFVGGWWGATTADPSPSPLSIPSSLPDPWTLDGLTSLSPYRGDSEQRARGQVLYQQQPGMLTHVVDLMEHEPTRRFLEKYFLNWDTADIVSLLIQLYHCLDQIQEATRLTHTQKMGLLYFTLSDPATRRLFSQHINRWKKDLATVTMAQ